MESITSLKVFNIERFLDFTLQRFTTIPNAKHGLNSWFYFIEVQSFVFCFYGLLEIKRKFCYLWPSQ